MNIYLLKVSIYEGHHLCITFVQFTIKFPPLIIVERLSIVRKFHLPTRWIDYVEIDDGSLVLEILRDTFVSVTS